MHPYDRGRIGPTIRSNPTWTLLGRCLSSINCENSKLGRTLLASHDPRRASAEAVELRISTSRPDNPRTPAPRQAAATSALRSGELSSPGTRTEGRVPAGFEQRAAVLTAKEAWSPSERPPYPHPTSTPHITSRLVYASAYFERRHFARDDTAHAARAFSIDPDIAHPASEKAVHANPVEEPGKRATQHMILSVQIARIVASTCLVPHYRPTPSPTLVLVVAPPHRRHAPFVPASHAFPDQQY
ncbi:uncharacterized protein PAN0_014d4971 [Moesziomyces antarcticus]|uniref:Uncharacterized protein n=1 Tax=Pseudozyma antarctica TaxID=84753 RepID=A0A081CJA2_PSEA2|nr:uncharacterized protein PAN0_014d4971 [Moesziomyces antarcticus]GAK66748.1 hypothetical protein PAN0_014d4971 [Moesziomyces antarcticus]